MSLRMFIDYVRLRNNLRIKPYEMRRLQEEKLRAIVWHAYENVKFYHSKFKRAGINPHEIKTIEDLAKVPTTTKGEIQVIPLDEMVARNVAVQECARNRTSGSTGMPLVTIAGRRTVAYEEALWLRAFLENGVRMFDKKVTLCEPSHIPRKSSLTQRLGIMKRKYISTFEPPEKVWAVLEEESPEIIEGYPSSLAILANYCEENGHKKKFRFAFTLAELLDKSNRKLIGSTFEAEVFDHYGSSEFSLMAWECRQHNGYHMNADSMIFEFLNDSDVVASGESGEITCTSLINYEMPLIRYRMNDVGVPIEELCSCGSALPLMKMLEGRCDDFLLTIDGGAISPTIFFPYPFDNVEGITQFRIIQEKRDKMIIQVATRKDFAGHSHVWEGARKNIQHLFGEDMHVEFEVMPVIPLENSGKLRKIISNVSK